MLKKVILFIILILGGFAHQLAAQETVTDDLDKNFLDTLIAYAKRNYPRVKAFQERTLASMQNVKKQKLGWFESVTFSYVIQPSNGTALNATNPVFLNGYQFGLFANIGMLMERPALIKQAKHELGAVQYEQAEYDKNLEAEVRKRYYNYLQQAVMLRLISKTVIDGNALMLSIKVKYEKSEVSFDEYSKAQITNNSNLQTKLETEVNLLSAVAAIEELIGTDFSELKKKHGTK